jgi:hypothetical protein
MSSSPLPAARRRVAALAATALVAATLPLLLPSAASASPGAALAPRVVAAAETADPAVPGELAPIPSATPTIAGAATVGRTVTAEPGAWADGAAFAYQWLLDGEPLAQAASVALSASAAGRSLTVTVTGSLEGFAPVSVTSAPVVVAPAAQTGTARISGTVAVGQTVAAWTPSWTPGAALTYQWYANGTAIRNGGTGATYRIPAVLKGRTLTVAVTGRLAGHAPLTTTSAAAKVAAGTLSAGAVGISGTVKVGQKVTATRGSWTAGTAYSYQWYANGKAIRTGGRSSSYTIPAAVVGRTLTVKVTGRQTGYTTLTRASAGKKVAAATLRTGSVTISDTTPRTGQKLTVRRGTWTGGTSFRYQWYANGTAIRGATSTTYTVASSLKGKRLTVSVKGTKAGYATATKSSAATARVTAPAPRPVATPPRDLDCGDFPNWAAAQREYERTIRAGLGDYHRLDADHDGSACDSMR